MSSGVLLDKAIINHIVGDWAQREKCYDVAVNRYYYSLYQKAIFILDINSQRVTRKHHDNIEKLRDLLKNNISDEDRKLLGKFHTIREVRNDADYTTNQIETLDDFQDGFEQYFLSIDRIVSSIIDGQGGIV